MIAESSIRFAVKRLLEVDEIDEQGNIPLCVAL